MRNPVQITSKVLLVARLLISMFLLESCFQQEDLSKMSPEELLAWALNKQKQDVVLLQQKEDLAKEKAKLDQEKEEQRKQQEEWEKKKQQEEEERLRLEEERKKKEERLERLEREEKGRKAKEDEERKKKAAEKNKLKKVRLDRENLRVSELMRRVANNTNQLEKTVEELAPHGKAINKALQEDGYIGYNLELSSNDVFTDTDIAVLVNHPRLERIVEIHLDWLKLSKPQLKVLFSHLKDLRLKSLHLRKLRIRYEQLENVGVSNLLPLFQGSFSYLTLLGGNVQDDKGIMQDLAKYLDELAGLQYLHFNNTGFLTLAPSLNLLPDLRYLDLHSCKIGDVGMQALAPCFKGITYLMGLDLSSNNLGPVGAQALAAHLKDLPNLRTLKLDLNHDVGLEGVQAIAPQLRHLAKLTTLSLHNTLAHAGVAGVRTLAPYLRDLPQLEMLNLESNDLGDEGVQALIPSLQNLPEFSSLDLTDNHISSVSAKSLVQYLNTIKKSKFHLYLGNNQLGDIGAQFFLNLSKDLPPCYIYVEYNNIGDEVASKLQQLSHVAWSINKYLEHNSVWSNLPINVDSYATSSKQSILEF